MKRLTGPKLREAILQGSDAAHAEPAPTEKQAARMLVDSFGGQTSAQGRAPYMQGLFSEFVGVQEGRAMVPSPVQQLDGGRRPNKFKVQRDWDPTDDDKQKPAPTHDWWPRKRIHRIHGSE